MELTEIYKDSLIYPTKDWNKLIIIGILSLIIGVFGFITGFSLILMNFILTVAFGVITIIIALIIGLIYSGYSLSIIKETIENKQNSEEIDALPDFDWIKNIVDGIKVLILNTVYMIIPFIVSIILAYALGLFNMDLINQYVSIANGSVAYNSSAAVMINGSLSSNPVAFAELSQFGLYMNIVQGIFSVLALIFTLFKMIAQAKLAETSKLSSIFEFKEIFDTIAKIGWGNYIIWFILLIVIASIIGFIGGMITLIPILGLFVFSLLFLPFLLIFESRAIGLIYNESKQ